MSALLTYFQEDPYTSSPQTGGGFFQKAHGFVVPAPPYYADHQGRAFPRNLPAGPAISPGVSNVRFALRPARRVHLDERQFGRLDGSQASCAFARSALCLVRFRGRARLRRPYFQIGRTFGAV